MPKKAKHSFQRARSDAQKTERRSAILEEARACLTRVGFEKFSMGPLAKQLGIARATLYLYFQTREELLLALHFEELQTWAEALIEKTPVGCDHAAFLDAYYKTATRSPLYLQLAVRSGDVIEKNISAERLIDLKMLIHDLTQRLASHLSPVLNLSEEQTIRVLASLYGLLLGLYQAMQPPEVDSIDLPEEIIDTFSSLDAESLFLEAGGWMIKGCR